MVISLNPNIFPDSLSGKRRAPVPTKWTLLLKYRMIMLQLPIFHTDIDAVPATKIICYLEIKYCYALKEFFQFPQIQESLQYFTFISWTKLCCYYLYYINHKILLLTSMYSETLYYWGNKTSPSPSLTKKPQNSKDQKTNNKPQVTLNSVLNYLNL